MTDPAAAPAQLVAEAQSAAADVAGMAHADNALKRPADDPADGPDAKRAHMEQQPGINGAPVADAAADVPAGEAAASVGEVKEEPASQELPSADAVAAVAVVAEPEQPTDGQEVKQEAAGRGGRSSAPTQGVDLGSFKLPADAVLKQEIPLPRRMASCVIGIKGQSVSKLRRESGAKIHVRPAAGREELDQVVEVEGPIEAVVTCVRMVGDLLASEDPGFKMVPKAQVTSRFSVLPDMIGPAIIGKGGTHAKHIKERTGVRIEVVPAASAGQQRQEIVLHGPPERVREAYHLLLGNIRKYGPANLPAGAVPNPLPFSRGAGRGEANPPWRSGRDAYSPGGRSGYGGPPPPGGRGAPPPPPPRGAAPPPPYRYDSYAPPAAYPPADPYRASTAVAAAPYAVPAAAAPAAASAYQAADTTAAAAPAAAAGGQQMMYILQDGVLKPLTVMYQQGATAATPTATYGTATAPQAVAQTTVLPAGYAAAPAATYGTAQQAAPASTGAAGATMYQQAATTAGTQYTYAVPSGDVSSQQTWTVQQLGGQVAAATSAPLAAAPATYTTATGYGAQATTQYATAQPTQYYYQPQ